ncbi:hypothetical protein E4U48_004531 [Claviceps purpurea]|nr:hypothetical protein E4U48_004531 [Claviceps purpurea]
MSNHGHPLRIDDLGGHIMTTERRGAPQQSDDGSRGSTGDLTNNKTTASEHDTYRRNQEFDGNDSRRTELKAVSVWRIDGLAQKTAQWCLLGGLKMGGR